jgi:hypothetical protein
MSKKENTCYWVTSYYIQQDYDWADVGWICLNAESNSEPLDYSYGHFEFVISSYRGPYDDKNICAMDFMFLYKYMEPYYIVYSVMSVSVLLYLQFLLFEGAF